MNPNEYFSFERLSIQKSIYYMSLYDIHLCLVKWHSSIIAMINIYYWPSITLYVTIELLFPTWENTPMYVCCIQLVLMSTPWNSNIWQGNLYSTRLMITSSMHTAADNSREVYMYKSVSLNDCMRGMRTVVNNWKAVSCWP